MEGDNRFTDEALTTTCPISCDCGGGVDSTALASRKAGVCVDCGMKVILD